MPPEPTKELLSYFDGLHRAHLEEPAVINGGKDAKLLAGISKSHGPERVKELMHLFFESDDDFIQSAGYTVGVFVSQCGKLIARHRKGAGRGYRPATVPTYGSFGWKDECDRLHGGTNGSACGNGMFHTAKVESERQAS
jgi:hypothetical protein